MNMRNAQIAVLSLLAGCGDMSGLGGTSQFACKAPVGVHCESLSATYYNSLANNLPSQRRRAAPAGNADNETNGSPTGMRQVVSPPTAGFAPQALRLPGRDIRVWIKAWQDEDKDLTDQSYVYLAVAEGQWQVAHVQQQERNAFARLAPPQPLNTGEGNAQEQPARPAPASPALPALISGANEPSGK